MNPANESSESESESSDSDVEVLGKRKRSYSITSTYPELSKVVVNDNIEEIKGALKNILEPLVCRDYSLVKNICDAFVKFVTDIRQEADLGRLDLSRKELAEELYADVLTHTEMDFGDAVANKMPLMEFDTSKSFEQLIQLCYDTTKTDDFKRIVKSTIQYSGAFLKALKNFRKHQENENVARFLQLYSKRLYNRHMENIRISISY